ncbi:MAG: hypothetical protein C0501_17230 [Isosphaera sp.]|nr:hypothetical protein [Isosphaera sp.]
MTILGKLLTFFCLAAVGAFAYFAVQDRAGRQTITAAALRHRLVVDGLPLGDFKGAPAEMPNDPDPDAEVLFPIDLGTGRPTPTVSRQLLETYFGLTPGGTPVNGGAGNLGGGGAVPNQLAEVRRVRAKIDEALKAADDKKVSRVPLLEGWLLYQPTTYEEREAVLRLVKADDAKGLEDKLNARFAAVLDPPAAADPKTLAEAAPDLEPLYADLAAARKDLVDTMRAPKRTPADVEAKQAAVDERQKALDEAVARVRGRADQVVASRAAPLGPGERQARLAHLLVHLDRSADWQKRVLAVVGVRDYARAVVGQANRVREMVKRPEEAIPADEAGYWASKVRLQEIAYARTTLANNQAELRRKWVEQLRRETDLVGQRETQLKAILAQYDKVKAEVDDLLARQAVVEAALFEVQREVAITLDEVYRLYDVLAARERDLLAAPRP